MPEQLKRRAPGEMMAEVVSRAPLGYLRSVETFGLVDGPGVRYVALTQGCYWRCKYCHNPETWETKGGYEVSAEDLFNKAWRYHNYWSNNGGVTVGGGEPLLQIEFVTAFFEMLKERGVHTALDTAGGPFSTDRAWMAKFERLMDVTDLVLLDLKAFDSAQHKVLTGWPSEATQNMGRWLANHNKAIWARHVLVPGLSDDEEDLWNLRRYMDGLATIERREVLPYNMLAQLKWEEKGLAYPLDGVPEPTAEQVAHAEEILGVVKPL